jgi:hypothetical protein
MAWSAERFSITITKTCDAAVTDVGEGATLGLGPGEVSTAATGVWLGCERLA